MNRILLAGIASFIVVVGVALMSDETQAQAWYGGYGYSAAYPSYSYYGRPGRAYPVRRLLSPRWRTAYRGYGYAGSPGYYGSRVHEAVLEGGAKVTGATVHFSDDEYDHGPILLQEAVPVLETDTADTLAARVQAAERRLVPEAIRLIAENRVQIRSGRTHIDRSG